MGLRAIVCAFALAVLLQTPSHVQRITWEDVVPLQKRLETGGITAATFASYVDRVRQDNARRVREGDLDHLVFYTLQSAQFTTLPSIEPALSAKALVENDNRIPADVPLRVKDLLKAIDSSSNDPRLTYFRALVGSTFPAANKRETRLLAEYRRVMKFVYDKEFVAQGAGPDAVANLYRARGLSTDTAIEAGYVVYNGLGVLKSLEPARKVRRVLIVGPGLDLAPRTSFVEQGPPESYQPWAVIDALVSLGLSRLDDLTVVGADINPRVVDHLRRSRAVAPALELISGIGETATRKFSPDYRDYFMQLGRSLGKVNEIAPRRGLEGHLAKAVRVRPDVAGVLDAEPLDIVTARLDTQPFDLIIATNILPYFDDTQLMLAMSNIAAMLAPGGVFMDNEPRPVLGEITDAVGLRFEQLRRVTIASVTSTAGPLTDVVMLHRKTTSK